MVEYSTFIKKKPMDSVPMGKFIKFKKWPQRIHQKKRFDFLKKLYLANPYGFSKQTKTLLHEFIKIFNDLNIEVIEPFERTKLIIKQKNEWAYDVARSNFHDLKECDCIFAIVNGNPPDEGVMIELGIAIALKKEIFLFRDDFRNCSDSDQYPLNLMLFLGLPKDDWEKYYFESLQDIKSNKKDLLSGQKNKQINHKSLIKFKV